MLIRPMLMMQLLSGAAPFATWNPNDKTANMGLSNGNLTATHLVNGQVQGVRAGKFHSTGDIYFEVKSTNTELGFIGFSPAGYAVGSIPGYGANSVGFEIGNGRMYYNSPRIDGGAVSTSTGDKIGVRYTFSTNTFTIYRNGTQINQAVASGLVGPVAVHLWTNNTSNTSYTANFGATAFPFGQPAGTTSVFAA